MKTIEISGLRRSQADGRLSDLYDVLWTRRGLADQLGQLPESEEPILVVAEEASTLLNENKLGREVFEQIARLGRKLGVSAELRVDGFMLADFGGSDLIRSGANVRIVVDRIAR